MIRPICRDRLLLAQKGAPATPQDASLARDLLDTLAAHEADCVGMAANMIGVPKRVIAVCAGPVRLAMLNPVLTRRSGPFTAEEGCLSLDGTRRAARYRTIEVTWQDEAFQPHKQTFTGWAAQIIQHEIDHCEGVII